VLDDQIVNYYRSYNNILDILGNMGGLLSMLLTIGKLIMYPLANQILFIKIA
jgi:hypothetical protein